MWFTASPAPPFYPNVVTVERVTDPAAQVGVIVALAAGVSGFAVKDSFASLPLSGVGFRLMFEARWLQQRRTPPIYPHAGSLRWTRITSARDLADWERAWRGPQVAHAGIFRPELLADPGTIVMAGLHRSGMIAAGGIGYVAAGALGITNIFGDAEGLSGALLAHVTPRRIMCYERGEDLRCARKRGFEALGPLRVWTRSA